MSDRLNFSPRTEQEVHNFRHDLMPFFPTSLGKGIITQFSGLAIKTITGQNRNIMLDMTVPHFENIAPELDAIESEASLLGVFSAMKLNNLRDNHLVKLGVGIKPRTYPFEKTVEDALNAFSQVNEKQILGMDATNLRTWLYVLKQFSDQYITNITLPDSQYDPRNVHDLIHEFPNRIEGVRLPVENLVNYPLQISFRQ